jgi:hypothetical protein
MADLSDKDSAQTVKVVGLAATPLSMQTTGPQAVLPTSQSLIGRRDGAAPALKDVIYAGTNIYQYSTNVYPVYLQCVSTADGMGTTGALAVKITYLDQDFAGPFTETLSGFLPGGGTPVSASFTPFVNSNICHVLKFEVVQAGSSGTNAGVLATSDSPTPSADIGGAILAGQLFWRAALYWVQPGKTVLIKSFTWAGVATGASLGGTVSIVVKPVGGVVTTLYGPVSSWASSGGMTVQFKTPLKVTGPATVYGRNNDSTASGERDMQIMLIEVDT